LVNKPTEDVENKLILQTFSFVLLSLCGLVMLVTYSLGGRTGVIPLAVFILVVNAGNLSVLFD
jgi:hypothetical protein